MATVTFDTLKFVETLTAGGVPEGQAKAIAQALATAQSEADVATNRDLKETETVLRRDFKELEVALKRDLKELEAATKRDLKELEVSVRGDMRAMETRLETRLSDVRADIIKWVAGLLIAQGAVVAALVKLL